MGPVHVLGLIAIITSYMYLTRLPLLGLLQQFVALGLKRMNNHDF